MVLHFLLVLRRNVGEGTVGFHRHLCPPDVQTCLAPSLRLCATTKSGHTVGRAHAGWPRTSKSLIVTAVSTARESASSSPNVICVPTKLHQTLILTDGSRGARLTKAQLLSVPDLVRTVMDTIDPNCPNAEDSCSSTDMSGRSTAKLGMHPAQIVAVQWRNERSAAGQATQANGREHAHSVTSTEDACCLRILPRAPVDAFWSSSLAAAGLSFNLASKTCMHDSR